MDFKLVMSYLPAYLTQFTKHHIIMAGVSLGGHTVWRMPALVPNIEAMAIVIGCPILSGLLLSRLDIDLKALKEPVSKLYKISYDDLTQVMNETQKKRWPRKLHEIVCERDRVIFEEEFPCMPLLLMGGKEDRLVPAKFTEDWFYGSDSIGVRCDKAEFELFVQDNTGHTCTKEMVWKLAELLIELYGPKK